jgi:hypothetical protein
MNVPMAAVSSLTEVNGAAADGLAGDDREEAFQVEPGAADRGEVQGDPRVLRQPRGDLGVLVGGVVVTDNMQFLARLRARCKDQVHAVLAKLAVTDIAEPASAAPD